MALRPDVLQAFSLLDIDPSSDIDTAAKAYKRKAFLHHPDRNRGDSDATRRFQEIGAAWNICQRHFDSPTWGYQASSTKSYQFSADDDIPLDQDELNDFYFYVFYETLFGRYSRTKGQRYRYQRSGRAGGGLATFSGGLAGSQARQARNNERQRKENEEYERRKRELELEIEQEEREKAEKEKQIKADADRRDRALEHAFRAASTGDTAAVKKAILDFDLDVNAPRKHPKHSRKQVGATQSDSLLHVAASNGDSDLFMFLLERGANPAALNGTQLNPFHSAIKSGNTRVVQFILEHRSRSLDSYHPSKAAASGRTPLQLAIESRVPAVVELLVKYATTHDVDRCWKVETISEDIKQVLLKKKGFVPPNNPTEVSKSSPPNKSQRKHELDEQKQARIADELARAAINRQKREDRAARYLEKERADAAAKIVEARRKAELEELDRKDHERTAQAAREKQLHEKRSKAVPNRPAVASGSTLAKAEKKPSTLTEEKKPPLNLNVAHNLNSSSKDMKQASSSSQTLDADIKDVKDSPPIRSTEMQRSHIREAKSKWKGQTRTDEKARANAEHSVLENHHMQAKNAEPPRESLRTVDKKPESLEDLRKRKEEANLRRRAEQSARDKERHRRRLEEQAKEKRDCANAEAETSEYIPLTPVSTHTTTPKNANPAKTKETTSESTMPVPPILFPSLVEFLTPREEIQTCIVPEDLFKDEPIVARSVVSEPQATPSRENGERGRYKRRGFRRA